MRTFDAVDLFVHVNLNLVLLSDSGDSVKLLPEVFRGEGDVEETVDHGVICS